MREHRKQRCAQENIDSNAEMAQIIVEDLSSNGFYVIQGELSILLNSMRRPFKWSSQIYQEEEQDVLIKNLNQLKEQLNQVSSLAELDLLAVLGPFLEVIRSEDTSGPVTELALSAVFKFLSYGLIDPTHESAAIVVESLADAVTHARFVGTDSGSDEVVLMKILHVLRMLILHPAGILLSNESVCEIMQSCFRICFETRLSELLRKSAEHSLSEMVRLLYERVPQFPLQEIKGSVNYKKLKMRTAAYDPSRNKKKSRSPKPRPKTLAVNTNGTSKSGQAVEAPVSPCVETPTTKESTESFPVLNPTEENTIADSESTVETPTICQSVDHSTSVEVETPVVTVSMAQEETPFQTIDTAAQDYVNAQGVRFISSEPTSEESGGRSHVPYGLPCVRELLRFLVSLINPLERQNSEAMIHVGLRLLTIAVETAADVIAAVPSLQTLIQDETCRSLFSLLNSDRLSVVAAACRLCFLLFESARTRLKFQLETYLLKLMEIVAHESPKVAYERRLVALEAIAQLCRTPGLVTELYLNYDCDCHTSDLFQELIKHLSKNVSPLATGGIYTIHLLSLEALLIVVDSIEAHCLTQRNGKGNGLLEHQSSSRMPPAARKSRLVELSADVPSEEHLSSIRHKKKLLIAGAEHFNSKPAKGIQFLQENGLLSDPLDPTQVAVLLRECSRLDKKMIGEYISNRKNLNVLEAFVHSFDFHGIRIDEALRYYLETFRLPGEAPLISLLMEQFADHWFKCNDAPFFNADAAFTLAYAVIMLNVDQHNTNVKRQNIPMTVDEFKRNLTKVNGGQDFESSMLEEIYQAIRSEEIVMPAEQTGLVKDNYLWKVLLRRGATKDGRYIHAPSGIFDRDLFALSWSPTMAALSCLLDKAQPEGSGIVEWVLQAIRKLSTVAAHFSRTDVFDHIVQTMIKFSCLLPSGDNPPIQAVAFGQNRKAQVATSTVFQLVQRHGDILREGWKPLVECIMQFYRMRVLPDELVEAEDPFDPHTKVKLLGADIPLRSETSGLFSSIYSYIALSEGSSSGRAGSAEEQESMNRAKACALECNIEQLISDSKFLQTNALQDFVKVLIASNDVSNIDEFGVIFVLELIIRITVQNRDRVTCIWNPVRDHIYGLVMGAAASDRIFILERSIVALLLLTGRLMRREDVAPIVLQSLRMLLMLKPQVLSRVSRQVSYGLHELLKTGAANVHTTGDWRVLFTLLECVGAGAQPPSVHRGELAPSVSMEAITEPAVSVASSDTDVTELPAASDVSGSIDRGYTSDSELYENRVNRSASAPGASGVHGSSPELNVPAGGGGWIFVGRQGEIEHLKGKQAPGREYNIVHDRKLLAHDPLAFVKSCESLTFLIRDVAHITPENFECAVQCIRTFVEASLNVGMTINRPQSNPSDHPSSQDNFRRSKSFHANDHSTEHNEIQELPANYHQVPVQLLDLMHTLHTRAAQIYRWWATESVDTETHVNEEKDAPSNFQLSPSLWIRGWCPLLQGIARLCCDSRKQVRTTAITYLQRSLLVHDLQNLTASEWESCFNTVLFPLLAKLLEPQRSIATVRAHRQADHSSWEETRIRAATLLSKVFLQHLGPLLQLPTFTALWLTLLDFMDKYMHVENNDLLAEAVPEMMKNLLLVMETAGVFGSNADELDQTPIKTSDTTSPQALHLKTQLWNMTCDRIDVFLPGLRQEITRSKTPIARVPAAPLSEDFSLTVVPNEVESPELAEGPLSLESVASNPEPPSQENPSELEEATVSSTDVSADVPAGPEVLAVEDNTNSTEVSEESKSPLNFVPQSMFSVWNVPDPSDAAALFFHDLTPGPADDNQAISDSSSIIEDEPINHLGIRQTPILPISLIPEDGSAIPVVPLPVFSTAVPAVEVEASDITQQQNPDIMQEEPQSDANLLPLILVPEVNDPSLTSEVSVLSPVNTQEDK